jgi:transcriptional regulator with XRE-family HTH domain
MTQWEVDMHARIAAAIKKHRAGRSAQDVADRTAELGYPISRTQIANYESGRKKNLDIAELLILAAALDVPPLVLIYPDLPAGKVEIIPGQPPATSWDAYLWATGIGMSSAEPSTGARLVEASLERHRLTRELARLTVNAALYAHDDAALRESRELEIDRVRAELDRANAVIRESGGVLNNA